MVERIIATDRELLYLDAEGRITDKAANGAPAFQLVGGPLTVRSLAEAYHRASRPTLPTKNGDDAIIETYLKHTNITGHFEREARNVWALYKTLTESKPLKDAQRRRPQAGRAFEPRDLKARPYKRKSDGSMPPSIWRSKRKS